MQPLNVFSGANAVKDYLNPDHHPPLPLVEIPECLHPFASDGVRIYAKLMSALPLANVKSLPALNMLLEKERAHALHPGMSIIENSSGNTVLSLAVIARLFGIRQTRAIVSNEVSPGKLALLRFFGVEICVNEEPICPDPSDVTSGIQKAKQQGRVEGWWNPGQYENASNPDAHRRWTGPQILEQTRGMLTIFCAGLGTTGTMVGVGGFLKEHHPAITNVGVLRAPNNPVPGVRTRNLLRDIAFPWKDCVDETVEIGTVASFEQSLSLCRQGIVVGPSSGFALAGLLEFIAQQRNAGNLDRYRNAAGEVVAVFLCPDSPFPYLQEYFDYLHPDLFPQIEQEELLRHRMVNDKKTTHMSPYTIEPIAAYEQIYRCSIDEGRALVDAGKDIPLAEGVMIVDVRDRDAVDHARLSQSVHVAYQDALVKPEQLRDAAVGKTVYVICNRGNRSGVVADVLQRIGVRAYSINGGFMEWSSLHLPRWRPESCAVLRENV